MQESNVQALGTLTRLLVNQANALLRYFSETVGYTVLNAESNMMYTLVALVEPLLDGALR
jgi:hypothetical protein